MRKQIVGFEDYWIDTEGKVWSTKKGEIKERKQIKTKYGYLEVILFKNNKKKYIKVHRLVAMAFLDNPEDYPQVNHINGIKTDNRLENLEWCSNSQNIKHAFVLGLKSQKGSKNNKAKLSEEDVFQILKRLDNGESPNEIAEDYPITKQTICDIKTGRRWSHLRH